MENEIKWKRKSETRPDTRQSSRGRLGRSSNAKTALNSKKVTLPTDLPTYRPTDLPTDTAMCRVACPRLKKHVLARGTKCEKSSINQSGQHNSDELVGLIYLDSCHRRPGLNWSSVIVIKSKTCSKMKFFFFLCGHATLWEALSVRPSVPWLVSLLWQVEQYPSLYPHWKIWKRALWALTDYLLRASLLVFHLAKLT